MKLSQKKKEKLKNFLNSIATDDEKNELKKLDAEKVREVIGLFEQEAVESDDRYKELLESFSQYAAAAQKNAETTHKYFGKFITSLQDKFENLQNQTFENLSAHLLTIGKSVTTMANVKPFDSAPVYKDIINNLSEMNTAFKNWKYPQYAAVSVRNKNFANINPATDGLCIGDFDYVARVLTNSTTETYTFRSGGVSGTIVATVILVYTDSTLATLLNVTKTPITSPT